MKTKQLVLTALFIALILLFGLTPIGMIPLIIFQCRIVIECLTADILNRLGNIKVI